MARTLPQEIAASSPCTEVAPAEPLRSDAGAATLPSASPAEALAVLAQARRDTLALVAHLDDEALARAHSPIMSPLVWDLAHIAAYEDLWLGQRLAGLALLRPDLAALYDAFETPRTVRSEIEQLDPPAARAYLRDVRERVADAITAQGIGDGTLYELVVRHELQHTETMRQTMAIAGILPRGEPRLRPLAGAGDWIEISAGAFSMGAGPEGFAYDNERPRHHAETPAFCIASQPVSNAEWLRFEEDGGYERREWWSREGWAWKCEHALAPHPPAASGDPRAPVCHISWFEADAYARAHRARLPTEAEWEKAASIRRAANEEASSTGSDTPAEAASTRRGADEEAAPGPYGGDEDAASNRRGVLAGVGQVWEWTSTRFHGYPGFVAHPYREYSEVFFGEDYLVLRGGSWATSLRVASVTFRNWDYPQRRQIFAGLRLARDLGA